MGGWFRMRIFRLGNLARIPGEEKEAGFVSHGLGRAVAFIQAVLVFAR